VHTLGLVLFGILLFVLYLLAFNWYMGQGKGHIILDLDERYFEFNEYIDAILHELREKGKEARYVSYRQFVIDGISYRLIERTVTVGGVPLQRTILKPLKRKK